MGHFIKFTNNSYEQSQTVDPDNLAIFLFPGVLGNGNELEALAAAIDKQRKGRTPIYIYNKPTINGSPLEMTGDEEAASIADEMQYIRRDSKLPYILAGFSYGSNVVHQVAEHLSARGFDPRKYVIDAGSPACIAAYIEKDNDDLKRDLVNIVNYAARLSGMQEIKLNEKIFTKLQDIELEDRIDHIGDEVVHGQAANIDEDILASFYTYLEIAKQNLRNLAYPTISKQNKTTHTHLILTKETSLKYGAAESGSISFAAGWDECSSKVTRLNRHTSSKLWHQTHMSLLTEENAGLVAGLITNSLNREITADLLRQRHAEAIFGTGAIFSTIANNRQRTSNPLYFSAFNPPAASALPHHSTANDKAINCTLDQQNAQTIESKKNLGIGIR
jgi:thioesterase domain-containing protein